jgi:hypothetical protein
MAAVNEALVTRKHYELNKRLRLTFIGSFFKPPKVPGNQLLNALNHAYEEGCNFELRIIGDKALSFDPGITKLAKFPIISYPRMPHLETIEFAVNSDWLVLLLGKLPGTDAIMHAKLPVYLATGIPILAVVPESSFAAEVIKRENAGIVIDPEKDLIDSLVSVLSKQPYETASQHVIEKRYETYGIESHHQAWSSAIASCN